LVAGDGSKAAIFLRGPIICGVQWNSPPGLICSRKSVYFLGPVTEDALVAAAEADVGIVPYLPLAINKLPLRASETRGSTSQDNKLHPAR
jgi:hypothetical protein